MVAVAAELAAHALFSCMSGISIAVTGFACDSTRELFSQLSSSGGSDAFQASSAINMGFSAAVVTAVQAMLQRQLINGGLLLNTLPLTFVGVVLSLNVFSTSILAALAPAVGACLLGLSMAKLWVELADCRQKASVRGADYGDERRTSSWRWTGVLATASLVGGLLSGRCAPPGPALMMVLLGAGKSGLVGGGEWRATAALVTCSSSMLRVGLLLLENGASVGPFREVFVLVFGGLAGVGIGNYAIRSLFSDGDSDIDLRRRTPPRPFFRRCVLFVGFAASITMASGGPPKALAAMARPIVLGTLVLAGLVASGGALWGCTKGADKDGARGAYGTVASDDHDAEVELKAFAGGDDSDRVTWHDDDYLDEEDGYLADEGETEHRSSRRVKEAPIRGGRGIAGGIRASMGDGNQSPAESRTLPPKGKSDGDDVDVHSAGEKKPEKKSRIKAPPAQSLFPAGHTMEL